MKPVDVKPSTYRNFDKKDTKNCPEFNVCDHVRYKDINIKTYYYNIALLYNCIIILLHYCIVLLHYYIVLLHYCINIKTLLHIKTISKYKDIIAKGYVQNWSEVAFVVKNVKNTVPWTMLLVISMAKKLLQRFNKFRI